MNCPKCGSEIKAGCETCANFVRCDICDLFPNIRFCSEYEEKVKP